MGHTVRARAHMHGAGAGARPGGLLTRRLVPLPQPAPHPLQCHFPHQECDGEITLVPVSVITHVLLKILTQKLLIKVSHFLCIQCCSLT